MFKSVDLQNLKLDTVEVTLEPILSSDSDSVDVAPSITGPNWEYGTSSQRVASRTNSGLCSSERGHGAVALPEVIQNILYPSSEQLKQKILAYRANFSSMLSYESGEFNYPLLVVAGPSFVHDMAQIKACALWVGQLLGKQASPGCLLPESVIIPGNSNQNLILALRTNLSKYNLNYDDAKNSLQSIMTFEIKLGMPVCRALLSELANICPIVGETADTITPQYLSDLYCLSFVSSTLVESQLHRELASGVSYSIGFNTSDSHLPFNKSMYKHKITTALDAMYASSQPHQFLSVTKVGTVAVVGTIGNEETFLILQVNLQLYFEELKEIIDYIYSHPRHMCKTPRIMLDVGKVSNADFDAKLKIMSKLLTSSSTRYKIIGVVIDSGDNYTPRACNSYEYFVNANNFIKKLGELSSERIRLSK